MSDTDFDTDLQDFKEDASRDYLTTYRQREQANEDMRFCSVKGGMWEGYLERTHGEESSRARLELDITSNYVQRFNGEWTQNRVNVTFTPDDEATTDDDADLLNSVYRADFQDNDGSLSQDNAVLELAHCGTGAFLLFSRFEDEEDLENDQQEIAFEPLHNAFNHVLWDSNAKRIDKADAAHCTLLHVYTAEAFERAFPDLDPVSVPSPANHHGNYGIQWVNRKQIYVAERFHVEEKREQMEIWEHPQRGIERLSEEQSKEMAQELKFLGYRYVRSRPRMARNIMKSRFTGDSWIEKPRRIPGKYIPVVSMYGYRNFVDGLETYYGLVRKLKDANRVFNATASRMIEASASSGDNIPIFDRDEIKGLSGVWSDKTNKAYLLKNPIIDQNGNRMLKPTEYLQPTQIDPNTAAMAEIVTNYTQQVTGGAPQDTLDPSVSGKAINALRSRENMNTIPITQNIIAAIKHSGRIYRSMAAEVYVEKRLKRARAEDGTASLVHLNAHQLDPKAARMVQVNDLSKGKYEVDVEVGPQYESQREATVETIERLVDNPQLQPEYRAPLMQILFDNMSGTGLDPIKKLARRQMVMSGLVEPETPEEEKMVKQRRQQAQNDPEKKLVEATAKQLLAEAQNLQAASFDKVASAEKKRAEAAKIVEETGTEKIKGNLAKLEVAEKARTVFYDQNLGRVANVH